ncbi:MAG: formylglycine-generating enzyme family protein [Kiritimatiellaeota bacterium]|nr:formylglycine-generating enzyme family protein [Kiritimatiellota bacterium]
MARMMKGLAALLLAMSVMTAQAGEVTVKDVTAQQRWPWNGLVDIDYTIESDDPNADVLVYPVGLDNDRNISIAPRTLAGDGAGGIVKPGTHRMTWDAGTDEPDFNSSSFTVKMYAGTGMMRYMVIDLSNGPAEHMFYPVRYTNDPPDISDDACRTTNLWLRLILPGTFMMGSPTMELGRQTTEDLHQVTLTKPFYIGVFQMTQRQYELVVGSNPSNSSNPIATTNPVNYVSWNTINETLLPLLRSRTGIAGFNFPTEAQWEYACRAGTGTAINNGRNLTSTTGRCANLDEVAWYFPYNGGAQKGVGLLKPNAWGLYDMHGNGLEWCLDVWIANLGFTPVTDPTGGTSGSLRVLKGGGIEYDYSHYSYSSYTGFGWAFRCRSAGRIDASSTQAGRDRRDSYCFRLACVPTE